MKYLRVAIIALMIPMIAKAQVVYDGGTGIFPSDAFEMSGYNEAMNFTLSSDAFVTGVSITTTYQGGGVIDPLYGFRGRFDWALFTDAAGMPGTLVASGSSVPTRTTQTILGPDFDVSQWTFSVTPTALTGTTKYWISLHNTDATGSYLQNGFYWEASGNVPNTTASASQANGVGPWVINNAIDTPDFGDGNRLSLQLLGATTVPEPSSVTLLAGGLLGLAGIVRRKRT